MDHRPVILEPSFYKYEDSRAYRELGIQWDIFAKELLVADCIIVIGYSFPEMDVKARSTILSAFQLNDRCKWLIVDPAEQVCGAYRRILGSQRVNIVQTSLAGFNNDIESHLQGAFPELDFAEEAETIAGII